MFFCAGDINDGVESFRDTPNAVLLDVREVIEYRSGHIPGAISIPLSDIDSISLSKDTPLFVYCLRGTRSRQAVSAMKKMGYVNVKSIGGIAAYEGEIER